MSDRSFRRAELAQWVADGRPVDWESVLLAAPAAEHAFIEQLRTVASVAAEARPSASADPLPSPFGRFTLLERVGAGSFGDVYRAHDPELDRQVALKISHARHVASGSLLREGRAIARLRHPNIRAVYAVERIEDRLAISTEFIDGSTLEDLVAVNGTYSVEEAAVIGVSVCRAVAAVHHAGLLHRDIKAQNVMRETGGRIVLMDFSAGTLLGATPTDLAGTPVYMAPESLAGVYSVQTDVYAIGVLLFYLVTGTYPIDGGSLTEVGAQHHGALRVRLRDARPDLPPRFVDTIERALAERPEARYATAGEFEAALREAAALPDATAPAPRSRTAATAAVLVALTATAAVLLWVRAPERGNGRTPVLQTAIVAPPDSESAFLLGFALAPDGHALAFSASGTDGIDRLWVRPLDSPMARPLENTEGAVYPFWSPDSREIAFFAQGKLKRIAAAGGVARAICDVPFGLGGTWSASGVILYSPNRSAPLYRVDASGGVPTAATTLDVSRGDGGHQWPTFLPDGRHFLFYNYGGSAETGTYLGSLDDSGTSLVVKSISAAEFSDGFLVFKQRDPRGRGGNTLVAQPFDLGRFAVRGTPVRLAEWVTNPRGWRAFSTSSSGLLAHLGSLVPEGDAEWSRLVRVDRQGRSIGDLGPPRPFWVHRVSHAGTQVLANPDNDLWVYPSDGGAPVRVVASPSTDSFAVWSPDDRAVAFASNVDGPQALYTAELADGTPRRMGMLDGVRGVSDWSPDGTWIAFTRDGSAGGAGTDIWLHAPRTGESMPLISSQFDELNLAWSPDGSLVAYQSDESGAHNVYVRPFRTGSTTAAVRVSLEGGTHPRWSRDGRELFFLSRAGELHAASLVTRAPLAFSPPHLLFRSPFVRTPPVSAAYDVEPDGGFLLNVPAGPPTPITLLQQWTRLLR